MCNLNTGERQTCPYVINEKVMKQIDEVMKQIVTTSNDKIYFNIYLFFLIEILPQWCAIIGTV